MRRYSGLIFAAALAPRPNFRIVRDPFGTATSPDQMYDMPTIHPCGLSPVSPNQTGVINQSLSWDRENGVPRRSVDVGLDRHYTELACAVSGFFLLRSATG